MGSTQGTTGGTTEGDTDGGGTTATHDEPTGDRTGRDGERRGRGQVASLVLAAHPRQALAVAVVVGALVALMGRPVREVLVSAAAVLVAQLALGLVDDVSDLEADRRSGAEGKPLAAGTAPTGNATFVVAALLIVLVPLSLQNGTVAGLFLLGSVVVGLVHHRLLAATPLSWVGWAATFALLTCFVAYGGWARETEGSAPVTTFLVLAAVLGVLVHVLTALPDLVEDNRAQVRSLPLRVALRTGAPRLLVVTAVLTVACVAALAWTALTVGIAR